MPVGVCLLFRLPDDVAKARTWLRSLAPHIAFNDGRKLRAEAVVTLALGASGLRRLGLAEEGLSTFPFAFLEGMTAEYRARILGDDPAAGPWDWDDRRFDVALLLYGTTQEAVGALDKTVRAAAATAGMGKGHAIPLVKVEKEKKTEPFGFVDGISQPVIRGTYKGLRNADPIHLVEPGEFVLGYPDNRGNIPPGPTLPAIADPENRLPLVEARDDFAQTQVEELRDLGKNGSFLVIRQLEQDVEGFQRYCEQEAKRLADRLPEPYQMSADFIAAKMVGRWKDGSSLVRHVYSSKTEEVMKHRSSETVRPEAKTARAAPPVARGPTVGPRDPNDSVRPDNDFLFGEEDPEGVRCPFGAHIRRANPRDSLDPGSADQIAITNRHRIMRVGRLYKEKEGRNPGLLFMCLNGDIERQFEFIQQTWLKRPSFHGLSCEKDPLLGDAEVGACSYTIPSREGPILLKPMPAFIKTLGGGYFFLPGKRLIEYLAG
jgi:deferrochelatase/peroxidase EfeB